MTNGVMKGIAVVIAIAVVAFAGYTAGASGTGQAATEDHPSLWQRLHALGERIHGHHAGHGHHGDEHEGHLSRMVEGLELRPEQIERVEAAQAALDRRGDALHGSMRALHEELIAQFRAGHVDGDVVRGVVDRQLDEVRAAAYEAMDEVVALANGLDAEQRDTMLRHLEQARERHGL